MAAVVCKRRAFEALEMDIYDVYGVRAENFRDAKELVEPALKIDSREMRAFIKTASTFSAELSVKRTSSYKTTTTMKRMPFMSPATLTPRSC